MKKVKLFFGLILFILFAFNLNAQKATTTSVQSQSSAIFSTSNSIELMGSSDDREIKIEVTEEGCNFNLDVSGEIREGSLNIEIIDSKGKKRGSFSTAATAENKTDKTNKGNYEERVNGRIMQKNTPMGNWIVKIKPANAHGRINIRYQQSSKQER